MALADPQSVTIGATPYSLPRVGANGATGKFATADGLIAMTVQHSSTATRRRHFIRLDQTMLTSDPFTTGSSFNVTQGHYFVSDVPIIGYTTTQLKDAAHALCTALTTSSDALLLKLLGGEQ
jgi:hypothetical protein